MTWQSALWEISLHQTTSVKRRNTGEKRQVTSANATQSVEASLSVTTWHDDGLYLCSFSFSTSLSGSDETSNGAFARGTQTGDLWTMGGILHSCCVFCLMDDNWTWRDSTPACLICRNMRPRAVQRPGWWKSLTCWRWSCRLTSTRSWRERQEDCRSSLTPPTVRLSSVSLFLNQSVCSCSRFFMYYQSNI